MAAARRQTHQWPRRPHTERRSSTRVTLSFPMGVGIDPKRPAVTAQVHDLGLGGVRATIDRYVELFTRFEVTLELPVVDQDGETSLHPIATTGALVRIEPDEEGEPGTEYDVAISFTRTTEEQERIIALCQLQMLLFDPNCRVL